MAADTDAWNHIPTDRNGTMEYLNLGRMYLYDGTFHKPTTMGWLGFELSRTPAPMDDHLVTLELAAASYLGQVGGQAAAASCYSLAVERAAL